VTGYDHCKKNIILALNSRGGNPGLKFSSSRDVLISGNYDSAISSFVLHESGPCIFEEIYSALKYDGILCIVDYNLKGVSEKDFSGIFVSFGEKDEIEKLGFEKAWKVHTSRGLGECVRDGEAAGFETVSSEVLGDNYFLWVGKKV